jgi:hypothetical protein
MTIITGIFPPWTSLSIDWKTKFTTLLTKSIAPVHWAFDDGLFTISAEYEFGRTITESNEYGVGSPWSLSWCPNQSLNSLRLGHA